MNGSRIERRTTFNRSADVYDRIRPGYPVELVEDVISLTGIPEGGRILEIGCGTGKGTEPFSLRGYSMDCLDIGRDLAAVASAKFEESENVRVFVSSFEEWEPMDCVYDMVMAATSFHWVDPRVAYLKSAAVLKSTGALAVFSSQADRKEEGFFGRVQEVYDTCAPFMAKLASESKKERE